MTSSILRHRAGATYAATAAATGLAVVLLNSCLNSCSEKTPPNGASTASVDASASAPRTPGAPPFLVGAVGDGGDGGDGAYDGPWLGSTVLQAPVWSEMDVPGPGDRHGESKSTRLGYLRYGTKVPVIPEAHKKPNCADGWYELLAGGFVCGKLVTLDLDHPKFKLARSPDLAAALPYDYGSNGVNGTPLYRHAPSRDERKRAEPWLFKPRKPKTDDESPSAVQAAGGAPVDGGDPVGENGADADIPWWERESPDGGPPAVTLEDLQESGGPVTRRMVKGFFLSLDRPIDASGAKWWKTVNGLLAPFDRIFVAKPVTEFHGVWLGKDAATYPTKNVNARRIDKLPVAFVLTRYAKRWTLDDTRKHPTVAEGALDRFVAVGLTGEKTRIAGVEYWETDEGFWLRSIDATITEPNAPPERLGDHEKWIDVNLRRQTLVAFEGAAPVFATMFSSGRNEHETPPGSFRIREKHISATMDSDTATDGPYSIEDVPYIEYFNAGYALHGAFWHGAFGYVKSHGCINLSPWDAKAVFNWTEPTLPQGWHAVFANKERPGTRVLVHERAPGTCQGPNSEPLACPERP